MGSWVCHGGKGPTLPSRVSRMESLLMSRWMTPWAWSTDKACSTARHTAAIDLACRLPQVGILVGQELAGGEDELAALTALERPILSAWHQLWLQASVLGGQCLLLCDSGYMLLLV